MKKLLLIALMFIPLLASAQKLDSLNQSRNKTNKTGMLVLGSWAVANIAVGSLAYGKANGSTKYLHQMNIFWNIVNLGIASAGYFGKEDTGGGLASSLFAQQKIEKILLVNAALDVAYMAGGLYLRERGLRKSSDRLTGYGKSILIQGAFLLVFDGTMYTLHRKNGRKMDKLLENVSVGFTGNGIGFQASLN